MHMHTDIIDAHIRCTGSMHRYGFLPNKAIDLPCICHHDIPRYVMTTFPVVSILPGTLACYDDICTVIFVHMSS